MMDDLPADFDALEARFFARRADMPRRLVQVGAFVLTHPDEIAFGTAASIAELAQVQPSTLVRFAQAMGLDGFSSLQRLCQARLRARTSGYDERLRMAGEVAAEAGGAGLLHGFLAAGRRSISIADEAITPEVFEKAIDILERAENIYLVARRRSYPIASAMAYGFGRGGVRTIETMSAAGTDEAVVDLARQADAAIVISFSPYAPETAALARRLAARKVPVVALTDSAFSPLVDCADVWLTLAEDDHAGFRSLSASIAVGLALTVGVAERRRRSV